MTSFFDEEDWYYLVSTRRSLKPLAAKMLYGMIEDVDLPEWEAPELGVEPLTTREPVAYDAAMSDSTEIPNYQRLLGVDDEREPTGFLNYRGRVNRPNPALAMGPTTFGEEVYPVTDVYDEETDATRVGVSPLRPDWEKIFGEAPRE